MKQLYLALATPLLLSAAPPPVDAETKSDVRCFLTLSGAVPEARADGDRRLTEAIGTATIYFLGRLDGRAPRLKLEEAMAAEATTARVETNGAIMDGCIEKFRRRLKEIMEVSKRLEKRGI